MMRVCSSAPYANFYGASMAHQPVAPYKKVPTHGVLWRKPFIPSWGMAHLWRNGGADPFARREEDAKGTKTHEGFCPSR